CGGGKGGRAPRRPPPRPPPGGGRRGALPREGGGRWVTGGRLGGGPPGPLLRPPAPRWLGRWANTCIGSYRVVGVAPLRPAAGRALGRPGNDCGQLGRATAAETAPPPRLGPAGAHPSRVSRPRTVLLFQLQLLLQLPL